MKALDVGSYYHEYFLRGQFDLLDNMVYNNGDKVDDKEKGEGGQEGEEKDEKDEDGDMKMNNNPSSSSSPEIESLAEESSEDDDIVLEEAAEPPIPPQQQQQQSEEVQNFLSFTNTSDPRIATQYLEMTSNSLEMAVSLFMDHGQPNAVALGLPPLAASAWCWREWWRKWIK